MAESSVSINHLDPMAKASVRAADDTAAAAALGLTFGSAERRGETLVARIRPDEWYLLGDGAVAIAAASMSDNSRRDDEVASLRRKTGSSTIAAAVTAATPKIVNRDERRPTATIRKPNSALSRWRLKSCYRKCAIKQ